MSAGSPRDPVNQSAALTCSSRLCSNKRSHLKTWRAERAVRSSFSAVRRVQSGDRRYTPTCYFLRSLRCRWKTATWRGARIWPRSSAWSAATVPPWSWPRWPWRRCWLLSSSTAPWGGSGGRPRLRPTTATVGDPQRREARRRAARNTSRTQSQRSAPRTQQVRPILD